MRIRMVSRNWFKLEISHQSHEEDEQLWSGQRFSKTHSLAMTKWNKVLRLPELSRVQEPVWVELVRVLPVLGVCHELLDVWQHNTVSRQNMTRGQSKLKRSGLPITCFETFPCNSCWWYLRSDSVHDWGGSHLTQSLTLCYECLTVLETGDQVSCQLLITSCSLHLLVTCLLQVRVQSEEHEAPAQGGGGGVWSSSKQVKTNHLQLRLAELFWILLHFQKILINEVSGIILIQSLFMSINLLIYKCSESLQDLKSPVVTSQWREDPSDPGSHQWCCEYWRCEDECNIIKHPLSFGVSSLELFS